MKRIKKEIKAFIQKIINSLWFINTANLFSNSLIKNMNNPSTIINYYL